MTDLVETFVSRLQLYKQESPAAIAALRYSLAFEPGAYPRAWAYVEPFVGLEWSSRDGRRLALYAVAGLYARHPLQQAVSLASSLGSLYRRKEQSPAIEARFLALLGADASHVVVYLRHACSLLAGEELGCDYRQLLQDLMLWLQASPDPERMDRLRQRWARDFYRPLRPAAAATPPLDTHLVNQDTSKS